MMRMKLDSLVGQSKSPMDEPPFADSDSLSLRSAMTSIESLSDSEDQKLMRSEKLDAQNAKQQNKKAVKQQENQILRLAKRLDVLQSIVENRTGKRI